VTGNAVSCSGSCAAVTSEGTCYSIAAFPTSPCTSDGTSGTFTSTLTGLLPSTTYNYRAFAVNSVGTAYGSVSSFTTPAILYVTGTGADGSGAGSTFTFSYTPTAANDAFVVDIYCHGASTPTSASLTASGWTFTTLVNVTNNGTADSSVLFGSVIPGTSTTTFTAEFFTGGSTPVPCASFYAYMLGEFTGNNVTGGATTFPVTGVASGSTGGCNQTAANITPISVNNAVWTGCFGTMTGANTPWTIGATDGLGGDVSEYQTLSGGAGVAQTPSLSGTSGAYIVMGVAISPTLVPPAGLPSLLAGQIVQSGSATR